MADQQFRLRIVSPDRVFYDDNVTMVEMKTSEGEIGVYAGHIPMTNLLEPGILHIIGPDGEKHAAVHEGFIEILPDQITVLAEVAEWPDEIDLNRANDAKIRAERRISQRDGHIDMVRAEVALRKALIRIELVERYK